MSNKKNQDELGASKPLKGKDLYDYVQGNKHSFSGNGDKLCVGAGYGDYSSDGEPTCNFSSFVEELSKSVDLNQCNEENNF